MLIMLIYIYIYIYIYIFFFLFIYKTCKNCSKKLYTDLLCPLNDFIDILEINRKQS